MKISLRETDVLVIGGGLAGLCAALRARESGCRVVIAAKGRAGRSGNTIMARNSMAAVMDREPGEVPLQKHIEDTLAGGAYLNRVELVNILVRAAREAILWLADCGVPFRRENGAFLFKGSPGHSEDRILTVDWSALGQSRTAGLALTLPLLGRGTDSGVEIIENLLVTQLIVKNGRVAGAFGFRRGAAGPAVICCRAAVLACGGAGRLYPLTTNTADVTGDGYALAYLAGAGPEHMEFIQFLPTMSLEPPRLAISNSPFSAGAVLRNRSGEDFMTRYSPLGCMATRDVMARAIFTELNAGRGGVLMDFSAVPPEVMDRKYADIKEYLRGRTTVEVAPAAHFTMGGVLIDGNCRTTVPGLYACGETAGGIHGANRLAGNALTEAAVFGLRAGSRAAGEMKACVAPGLNRSDIKKLIEENKVTPGILASWETDRGNSDRGVVEAETLAGELREIMGRYVGLVRCREGLTEARRRLAELRQRLENCRITHYRELLGYHRLRLMLTTAELITEAALARKESAGAHYRED
ncbi:succinate dehydrogenase flavoprotein subunit [Desulfocucumis palustris]|uniref:L-aspartate oxidase n=1 Tax=Desulfocucumis palustris TaxID=1898651 RepID=A0A2L2XCM9_9FIRM|nr:FAD-binding protein [Desulfocucumis palustris]GBF33872.1 succinate dehydrogenase flavoprotein subunit [Desulfocucumis palustris]